MPFNADTYRMNRHRREAWERLAKARAIKARVQSGEAYEWETGQIAFYVRSARLSMCLYRHARLIRELSR